MDEAEIQPEGVIGCRKEYIDERLHVVLLRQFRSLHCHPAQYEADDREPRQTASRHKGQQAVQHGMLAQGLPRGHGQGPKQGSRQQEPCGGVKPNPVKRVQGSVGDDPAHGYSGAANEEKPVQNVGKARLLARAAFKKAAPAVVGADEAVQDHERQDYRREIQADGHGEQRELSPCLPKAGRQGGHPGGQAFQ